MGLFDLILLALGVSMDAFAVSICKGLSVKKAGIKEKVTCGLWFGGFQALMPLIGFLLGALFAAAIEAVDHWIAFALLGLIGINMLREAFSKEEEPKENCGDMSAKTMFIMAVATSIDALAVGISLAMAGDVNIFLAISLIGATTFLMSAIGVHIGSLFGSKFEKKAEALGGMILIILGLKILLEHLEILG